MPELNTLEELTVFKDRKYKISSDVVLPAIKGKLIDPALYYKSTTKEYHEHTFLIGDKIEITKYIYIMGTMKGHTFQRFYYFMHFTYLNLTAVYWENVDDIPPDFVTAIPFNYNVLWNQLTS